MSQNAGAIITESNLGIQARGDVTLAETNVINGNVAIDLRVIDALTSGNITFHNTPSDLGWVMNGAAGIDNVFRTDNGDILINSGKSINIDDDSDAPTNPGVVDPTVELSATTQGIGSGNITINVGAGTTDGRDFTTNDATDGNLDQVDIVTDGDLNINLLGTGDSRIIFNDSTNIDVGGNVNFDVLGSSGNSRIVFHGGTTLDAGGDINFTVQANNGSFQTNNDDGNPVVITSTGGTLTVDADRWFVNLAPTPPNTVIDISGQEMVVTPFADGDNIILGVGTDAGDGTLRISNAELGTITGDATSRLTFGDAATALPTPGTGNVQVSGNITLGVDTVFAVTDGSTILDDGVVITSTQGNQTYNDEVEIGGSGATGQVTVTTGGGQRGGLRHHHRVQRRPAQHHPGNRARPAGGQRNGDPGQRGSQSQHAARVQRRGQ